MKNLVAFSFLFVCFQTFSQISYGPSLGIGFSRQSFPVLKKAGPEVELEQTRYIIVPVVSFGVDVPLSKILTLKTEIGFRQQGYSYIIQEKYNYWGSYRYRNKTFTTTLSYLELPVNLSVKLPFANQHVEILLGGTIGRFLSGKGTYENGYKEEWGDRNYIKESYKIDVHAGDIEEETQYKNPNKYGIFVKPYNFNLNIGLGFKITNSLNINGTFNYGLTNLQPYHFHVSPSGYNHSTNKADYENFRESDGKVKTYSYTLSFSFRFGGKGAGKD